MKESSRLDVTTDEVCRRYQAGESIATLVKSFKADWSTIRSRLTSGGVKVRTNTEIAGITPEIELGMVAAYMSGKGSTTVAKEFGFSQIAVFGALKRAGVETRENKYPTYSINDQFWESDTRERSYWLGFSLADGSTADRGKKGLVFIIGLIASDARHIEKFLMATNGNQPVRIRDAKRRDGRKSNGIASVTVNTRKFVEGAISIGIFPRKTWSAESPERFRFDVDFWRGAIDGDGSVEIHSSRPMVRYSGHKESHLPLRFREFCESLGLKTHQCSSGGTRQGWTMSVLGADAVRLARILYSEAPEHLRLDRKYESWKKIEELVQKKAADCVSAVQIKNYGQFWTSEQVDAARARVKSHHHESGNPDPPSRKGMRKINGVWVKPS